MKALVDLNVETGPGSKLGRLIVIDVEDFTAIDCLNAILKYVGYRPDLIKKLANHFLKSGRMSVSIEADKRDKDKKALVFRHTFRPGDYLLSQSDEYDKILPSKNKNYGEEELSFTPMPETLEILSKIDKSDTEAILNL